MDLINNNNKIFLQIRYLWEETKEKKIKNKTKRKIIKKKEEKETLSTQIIIKKTSHHR